jgi:hypothetical protein
MNTAGNVIFLTGVVKAISADGEERVLHYGDKVYVGDQIITDQAGNLIVELENGKELDLGRNSQTVLDEEILNLDFEISQEDIAEIKQEVQATQEALLTDQNYDPTADQEAPAAGEVQGSGDDDGFSIIQIEYAEPRAIPVSGFETTGINFSFPDTIPELILETRENQPATGIVLSTVVGGSDEIPPLASIFTLSEDSAIGGPDLIEGDSSKWLGFKVDPSSSGDVITSITIKGFPENGDPTQSDWLITPHTEVSDSEAQYQVIFQQGPVQAEDGTWEFTVEVISALPGESVEFVIPVIPLNNISDSIPLTIETTIDNDNGGFVSSSIDNVNIAFLQDESPEAPTATIFTVNEESIVGGPELEEGGSSKWLGFRIEPSSEDKITSVTIKGFPENDNSNQSDWMIAPFTETPNSGADYQVSFQQGPVQSLDGTWEITIDVEGSAQGEAIEFVIPVIPLNDISDNVPLTIETTVENSNGLFTSTTVAEVGITFTDVLDSTDSIFTSSSVGTEAITIGPVESSASAGFLPVSQDVQPGGFESISTLDVL